LDLSWKSQAVVAFHESVTPLGLWLSETDNFVQRSLSGSRQLRTHHGRRTTYGQRSGCLRQEICQLERLMALPIAA
jgi:hypothetical protein